MNSVVDTAAKYSRFSLIMNSFTARQWPQQQKKTNGFLKESERTAKMSSPSTVANHPDNVTTWTVHNGGQEPPFVLTPNSQPQLSIISMTELFFISTPILLLLRNIDNKYLISMLGITATTDMTTIQRQVLAPPNDVRPFPRRISTVCRGSSPRFYWEIAKKFNLQIIYEIRSW